MTFAILGMFFYAIANTLFRYVSLKFDIYKNLFFQYIFMSLFGFVIVLFFDKFSIDFSGNYQLFSIIGLSGFLGIWSFMKAMQNNHGGIVFIVSNLYVIFSYFINNYLFPELEKFSIIKIVFALTFFVIVSIFLIEKNENKKLVLNSRLYFAVLTAISWMIYTSATNFAIKNSIFSAFQGMFYCETFIAIISIFVFIGYSILNNKFDLTITKHQVFSYVLVSFFISLGALNLFFGYKYIGGNYVNIIQLFQIPLISIFSYFFLKDKLNKIQMITIFLAFLSLLGFIIF